MARAYRAGESVVVTGGPPRYPWMEVLDGEVGVVKKLDTAGGTDIPVYGVAFPGLPFDDLLWFGASYLEPVAKEGAA